eukprot:3201-Chlamydomonas_euryale.AAC.1
MSESRTHGPPTAPPGAAPAAPPAGPPRLRAMEGASIAAISRASSSSESLSSSGAELRFVGPLASVDGGGGGGGGNEPP